MSIYRNYGPAPSMRKGDLQREMIAAKVAFLEAMAPKLDEYFNWQIEVRGLSESAAIVETRSFCDQLSEGLSFDWGNTLADILFARRDFYKSN